MFESIVVDEEKLYEAVEFLFEEFGGGVIEGEIREGEVEGEYECMVFLDSVDSEYAEVAVVVTADDSIFKYNVSSIREIKKVILYIGTTRFIAVELKPGTPIWAKFAKRVLAFMFPDEPVEEVLNRVFKNTGGGEDGLDNS